MELSPLIGLPISGGWPPLFGVQASLWPCFFGGGADTWFGGDTELVCGVLMSGFGVPPPVPGGAPL